MSKIFLAGSSRYLQEKDMMQVIKDKLTEAGHEVWWCPEKEGIIYGAKGERIKEIVERESDRIRKSDYVVAVIKEITPGTMMEIMYSAMNNVPVIAISNQFRLRESPWFMHFIPQLVSDVDEAIEAMANKKK